MERHWVCSVEAAISALFAVVSTEKARLLSVCEKQISTFVHTFQVGSPLERASALKMGSRAEDETVQNREQPSAAAGAGEAASAHSTGLYVETDIALYVPSGFRVKV